MTLDLTGVPALTLRNPWAHLIAHHGKNVENRGWKPPARLRRFLVHAGAGWDDYPYLSSGIDFDGIVPSAVVAVVDVDSVCDASRYTDTLVCDCGEWAVPGQVHWRLVNVAALPQPVPCKGRQGLWRPDNTTAAAVARQLSGAAA